VSRLDALQPAIERLERVPEVVRATAAALAVVGLSMFAVWPLFGEGMILTGDNLHAWRLFEMHQCIDDGQVPCRWAADLGNGYGLPLFNFYPPLPYYLGDLLHRLGLSYLDTVDALFAIALIGAGLSMFMLGRALWGNLGGIVCGVAYVYAPYLALDVYMRGALGELWALAIAPALFWAVYRLVATDRPAYVLATALFTGLLMLSHSLGSVIVLPMAAIWGVGLLATHRNPARPALLNAAGALWGLGLAAFYSIPVLVEGDNVQLENTTRFLPTGPLLFETNFVTVQDLFLERSADYSALLAGAAGTVTPVQIGWFHWALAAAAVPAALLLSRAGNVRPAVAVPLLCLFFFAGVYMALSVSEPAWDTFGSLRFLQFPWRYVGLAAFASATLAGAWLAILRRPPWAGPALAVGLVALFLVSGLTFHDPYYRCTVEDGRPVPCPGSDDEYFSDGPYAQSEQGSIRDYLPEAVEMLPEPRDEAVTSADGDVAAAVVERESDRLVLAVEASSAAKIEASVFDYPGWSVSIDGEEVLHDASEPHGLITFEVPPGEHDVEIVLGSSGTARLANWVSLVSWAALFMAAPFVLLAPLFRRGPSDG